MGVRIAFAARRLKYGGRGFASRTAAMTLQQAEEEGWISFRMLGAISCSDDWFDKAAPCGRMDTCVKCAVKPTARCKAFMPREEMLRTLGSPTTQMLREIEPRKLSIMTASGWRFFYRAFLPVLKEQEEIYKEELASIALPPMTLLGLTITAQQRLLTHIGMWVRMTNTYGVKDIVLKASHEADKHSPWQRERCEVLVKKLFPTRNEAEQVQVVLAMKGLAHVAEYHRMRPLSIWIKAATAVVPLPEDSLHNDVTQCWIDATASSDYEVERHGKSWGRKTDEELQADFIEDREAYIADMEAYIRSLDSSDESERAAMLR